MKRQQGLTLLGLIFAAVVIVLLAILTFKLVPVVIEYNTIERQFRSMAADPTLRGANRVQLERAWIARAEIDRIKSVTPKDIDFAKTANGLVITAAYSVKVPLFGNVSACIDFTPSSE
jgi:hypothetical protein